LLYPFLMLDDETEIVHSEFIIKDGKEQIKVCIEKPIEGGFQSATCWLPDYQWQNVQRFSEDEIQKYEKLIKNVAHKIFELAGDSRSIQDQP